MKQKYYFWKILVESLFDVLLCRRGREGERGCVKYLTRDKCKNKKKKKKDNFVPINLSKTFLNINSTARISLNFRYELEISDNLQKDN